MGARATDARGLAGGEPLGSLDALVKALRALPGVGPRAAQRPLSTKCWHSLCQASVSTTP